MTKTSMNVLFLIIALQFRSIFGGWWYHYPLWTRKFKILFELKRGRFNFKSIQKIVFIIFSSYHFCHCVNVLPDRSFAVVIQKLCCKLLNKICFCCQLIDIFMQISSMIIMPEYVFPDDVCVAFQIWWYVVSYFKRDCSHCWRESSTIWKEWLVFLSNYFEWSADK
jgi:hypothetical protein